LNLKEGNNVHELRLAYRTGADAITHELEDHFPTRFEDVARKNIRLVVEEHGAEKPTFVRISTVNSPEFIDDLEAIVCKGRCGVTLPKVQNDRASARRL
jgi:citrate lyase subunit beta / citryl-CoA lyase